MGPSRHSSRRGHNPRNPDEFSNDPESGKSNLKRGPSFTRRERAASIGPDDPHYHLLKSPWQVKLNVHNIQDDDLSPGSQETAQNKAAASSGLEGIKIKSSTDDQIQFQQVWTVYCRFITLWCPNAVLGCFGIKEPVKQDAWREKIGLISIILLICGIVGFLTFGFTETVCPADKAIRLRANEVSEGYMIFHGQAYDLSSSQHPAARGIPKNANVLYDLPDKFGGKDGSFLFQNVNGACKKFISPAPDSNVPTNRKGEMGWYFPCTAFNQDGSSEPSGPLGSYHGYGCHTSSRARKDFYSMKPAGDVYYTWNDIKNSSRNLVVWGGDVVDLNLLSWFNTSDVEVSSEIMKLQKNKKLRGTDITRMYSTDNDKQIGRCLTEIAKVGSIDTDTIGCIASRVVLYVSLVFILSIVLIKFLLALIYQWFISKRYDLKPVSRAEKKARNEEIEKWSTMPDIYQANNAITPAVDHAQRNNYNRRRSRFANHENVSASAVPVTMTNASSLSAPTGNNRASHISRSSVLAGNRASRLNDHDLAGPLADPYQPTPDCIAQPLPDYQFSGFPLAHTILLVTAYSEGAQGLRVTLDSIATTDYPNSHKLILVICDGMVKGEDEGRLTPLVVLSMLEGETTPIDQVQERSYAAVASGDKRHNMAKVYSGFYKYEDEEGYSKIAEENRQKVPMIVIVKCGSETEVNDSKPGNRGKRDSQIVLMSFLQKVMFNERMTELDFELYRNFRVITGQDPQVYEIVLMVDADTMVFPDSVTHMVSAMVKDPKIMGLCGETKIANKRASWVSWIQVFEYFISHHLSKSFESVFGGVTCLPGCFCMYRIKAPTLDKNWVPILADPDIVENYSENEVDTLHKKNLLSLGEDRYLTTLMLKNFPSRKQVFVPQAICRTVVPEKFMVLLSQRRRWINSTVHNLMELVLVRDLCGTFCFSMQFVVFIELVGTLVLPAAISFTIYLIVTAIIAGVTNSPVPVIPLILLALILGLPGVLIVVTAHRVSYIGWMLIYLCSLVVWNFVLPTYAYWKFDDFTWGETRKTSDEPKKGQADELGGEKDEGDVKMNGEKAEGKFNPDKVKMKSREDWELLWRRSHSQMSYVAAADAPPMPVVPVSWSRDRESRYLGPY